MRWKWILRLLFIPSIISQILILRRAFYYWCLQVLLHFIFPRIQQVLEFNFQNLMLLAKLLMILLFRAFHNVLLPAADYIDILHLTSSNSNMFEWYLNLLKHLAEEKGYCGYLFNLGPLLLLLTILNLVLNFRSQKKIRALEHGSWQHSSFSSQEDPNI